jgi:hypothetical protein
MGFVPVVEIELAAFLLQSCRIQYCQLAEKPKCRRNY